MGKMNTLVLFVITLVQGQYEAIVIPTRVGVVGAVGPVAGANGVEVGYVSGHVIHQTPLVQASGNIGSYTNRRPINTVEQLPNDYGNIGAIGAVGVIDGTNNRPHYTGHHYADQFPFAEDIEFPVQNENKPHNEIESVGAVGSFESSGQLYGFFNENVPENEMNFEPAGFNVDSIGAVGALGGHGHEVHSVSGHVNKN